MKRLMLVVTVAACLALMAAIWAGGRKKWELIGDSGKGESLSSAYEKNLKENPSDLLLKYNLACFYYRQGRFEDAEKLLGEIMDSPDVTNELAQKSAYNLGDVLYRISQKAATPEEMLPLLKRSLGYFKQAVESSRDPYSSSGRKKQADEDAAFNFALTKQRIKILSGLIKKQQQDKQRKKELYVLLNDLLAREKKIQAELEAVAGVKDMRKRNRERTSLLDEQLENIRRLNLVRERIRKALSPGGASAGKTI